MALTERSAEVLRAIYELAMSRGYCPTVREVGARVGLASSSSVWFQVERLRRAGYVTDDIGKARTLRLSEKGIAEVVGMLQDEAKAEGPRCMGPEAEHGAVPLAELDETE